MAGGQEEIACDQRSRTTADLALVHFDDDADRRGNLGLCRRRNRGERARRVPPCEARIALQATLERRLLVRTGLQEYVRITLAAARIAGGMSAGDAGSPLPNSFSRALPLPPVMRTEIVPIDVSTGRDQKSGPELLLNTSVP
jgi:hypothetical protein